MSNKGITVEQNLKDLEVTLDYKKQNLNYKIEKVKELSSSDLDPDRLDQIRKKLNEAIMLYILN